jgi:hypothetical protein
MNVKHNKTSIEPEMTRCQNNVTNSGQEHKGNLKPVDDARHNLVSNSTSALRGEDKSQSRVTDIRSEYQTYMVIQQYSRNIACTI